MNKTSTPQLQQTVKSKSAASPRRSTVEFLRQFARAYTFDSRLGAGLGAIMVN